MACQEYPYAGLILPDASDMDPAPYLDAAQRALARHDPVPGGVPHRSAHGNRVLGEKFGVIVVPEEDSDYGPRMLIEVVTAEGELPEDEETAAAILSDTALASLEFSSADILEWYAPDVLITRQDFIRLRAYTSTSRNGSEAQAQPEPDSEMSDADELQLIRRALQDCEEIAQALRDGPAPAKTAEPQPPAASEPVMRAPGADNPAPRAPRFEDPETLCMEPAFPETDAPEIPAARPLPERDTPEERRLRSAGWLMIGALGVFSAPVAAFVYIISLFRGLQFRLVSQSLAVTALFAVLYNTDRLQQMLRAVVH